MRSLDSQVLLSDHAATPSRSKFKSRLGFTRAGDSDAAQAHWQADTDPGPNSASRHPVVNLALLTSPLWLSTLWNLKPFQRTLAHWHARAANLKAPPDALRLPINDGAPSGYGSPKSNTRTTFESSTTILQQATVVQGSRLPAWQCVGFPMTVFPSTTTRLVVYDAPGLAVRTLLLGLGVVNRC
eukprot:3270674-Rhodomonas_salina.2